jgi:hypothetical protein
MHFFLSNTTPTKNKMGTIKDTLQESFPDATEAEVTRFINAYGNGKPEDEKKDEYEGEAYQRSLLTMMTGRTAWVYHQ